MPNTPVPEEPFDIVVRKLRKPVRQVLSDSVQMSFHALPEVMRNDAKAQWVRKAVLSLSHGTPMGKARRSGAPITGGIIERIFPQELDGTVLSSALLLREIPFYYGALRLIGSAWMASERMIADLERVLEGNAITTSVGKARAALKAEANRTRQANILLAASDSALADAYREIIQAALALHKDKLEQAQVLWSQWQSEVDSLMFVSGFLENMKSTLNDPTRWKSIHVDHIERAITSLARLGRQSPLHREPDMNIPFSQHETGDMVRELLAKSFEILHSTVKRYLQKPKLINIRIIVNGVEHHVEVEPRTLLVSFLRENLDLTGTHVGCDTGQCGACTIMLDGQPVKSCMVLAVQADGAEVMTVEGLAQNGKYHPIQEAFWEKHGLQCGFCTPGMMIAAVGLLQRNPLPTDEEIREQLGGNLCRCTGYQNIVAAVRSAAEAMRSETYRPMVRAAVRSSQTAEVQVDQIKEEWERLSPRVLRDIYEALEGPSES